MTPSKSKRPVAPPEKWTPCFIGGHLKRPYASHRLTGGKAVTSRAPKSGLPAGEGETKMNRNYYTGSSHELLRGDVCLSWERYQIPPPQDLLRGEAKGQCVPVREVRSGRVAGTSPECSRREPEVAYAVEATLPRLGEAQANRTTAWVVRAGMVTKGSADDRGRSCIVPDERVAERRTNKPDAMRCKNSDRLIVVMTLPERATEAYGMGSPRVGPRVKSKGTAKGSGIGWNLKRSAGNRGMDWNAGRQYMGAMTPPLKVVEGSQGPETTIRKPPEMQMADEVPRGKSAARRVGEGTTGEDR